MEQNIKIITQNKKAYHDYFIEDTYECGIALAGTEVKSIRLGHVNLKDSFASLKSGEVVLIGMHIRPVVVPVRASVKKIGFANLVLARSRCPDVGGERTVYDKALG